MFKEHLKLVREFKGTIGKRINIAKMVFFGSRATGGFTKDSDFDILIVSKGFEGKKSFKRSPELHMLWDFDFPVDILCYTPDEFKRRLKGINIVSEVMKNGIVV